MRNFHCSCCFIRLIFLTQTNEMSLEGFICFATDTSSFALKYYWNWNFHFNRFPTTILIIEYFHKNANINNSQCNILKFPRSYRYRLAFNRMFYLRVYDSVFNANCSTHCKKSLLGSKFLLSCLRCGDLWNADWVVQTYWIIWIKWKTGGIKYNLVQHRRETEAAVTRE